jgi:asparaginyl-tRNA synthetase
MNRLIPRTLQRVHYSTVKPLLPFKTIKTLLREDATNVAVRGWVRSVRKQKQVCFATVNDGSNLKGIQAILDEKEVEL